jgi:hypothetical protein
MSREFGLNSSLISGLVRAQTFTSIKREGGISLASGSSDPPGDGVLGVCAPMRSIN